MDFILFFNHRQIAHAENGFEIREQRRISHREDSEAKKRLHWFCCLRQDGLQLSMYGWPDVVVHV